MSGPVEKTDANPRPEEPLPLCFIVDDEPAVGRFIALALRGLGLSVEQFRDVPSMLEFLGQRLPGLIFLDISLGDSDAIDAIRGLAMRGFTGVVQVMSGSNSVLLEDVRRVGERHGLRMRPPLAKPFRIQAVERIVEEERLTAGMTILSRAAVATAAPEASGASPRIDLREALEKDWLEFWYQPKLDLRRGRLVGAEALARVRHPEFGIVPPGSFIPGAAPADLIDLAEHALRSVLRATAEFMAAGRPLRLAMNVPVDALLSLPIPAIVREFQPGHGDWPGIIIEITEDQVIRDIPTVHEIATQLRIYQVALAIDDFGSGYSSLARLKELPFAELKLDRSFVTNCSFDPTNAALCGTVVDLAHRFGSLAVAEGIETKEDLATIRRVGCDIGQGFLFAHAMPKEFLLARMAAHGADGGLAATIEPLGDYRASA
ncbi:MAG: EAL domain-containing response regulator [Bauldia sp.]